MRRRSRQVIYAPLVLAGAVLMLPAFSHTAFAQDAGAGQPAAQQPAQPQPAPQQAQEPQKTTYTGEMVIVSYAVNPDKTADYEKVLATLKDSLSKSTRPEAKQQLAGWKVMRAMTPQPDGSIVYVHVITPVVPNADYSITNLVYETVTDPMERLNFYNMYRGALKSAIFLIQGPVPADFSK